MTVAAPDPLHVLKTVFGYDAFRGPQADIVDHVSSGGDALVLMPTGGGKSLCYQVPALLREGVAVVVSPLIALMKDQVDALRASGVPAAYLNSSLSPEGAREVEEAARAGELQLLYVAPERLVTERFLRLLDDVPVALFAIDEAHCVSQWGHDFRPEYLQLAVLAERYPGIPRVALTATADARTRQEIAEKLHLTRARRFVSSFDRPNIQYRVVEKQNALRQLLEFITAEYPQDAGIVYCLSRKSVEETAAWLSAQGVRALPYHAGMSGRERDAHQERFLKEEGIVMVATVAFGMGIDKPDVRFVAHLDLPKSLEGYYQETGRAGRDGLPSTAFMTYGLSDVVAVRRLLAQSAAPEAVRRAESAKLDALLAYAETAACRREAVLRYFGEAFSGPCGNCDTCLNPLDTWDATVAAQKALSAAVRTGNRFGAGHLINVLLGKDDPRVRALGHHTLSVYGVGQDLTERQWRGVLRQLVALGHLTTDAAGHGSLIVTGRARPVLRGEETLLLRREPEKPARGAKGTKKGPASAVRPEDAELFGELRARRLALAKEAGVPPYVIFHDATLRAMAEARPQSLAALGDVSGVGAAKLEKYGVAFLEVLRDHAAPPAPTPFPPQALSREPANGRGSDKPDKKATKEKSDKKEKEDTLSVTLRLFQDGLDIPGIAEARGISPQTVSGHLADLVRAARLTPEEATGWGEAEMARIQAAYDTLAPEERGKLKPLREATGDDFDYDRLRIAHAAIHAPS